LGRPDDRLRVPTAAVGGHGAPKSSLPDFGTQNVSKSATADFDERAFAHPTLRREKFGLQE